MRPAVPFSELQSRMTRFRARMEAACPRWQMAALFDRVNQYYFTGTMQDGVLLIPRDAEAVYWVRRSYERALDESLFPRIEPMDSYRDAAQGMGPCPETIHLEAELVPLAMLQRFRKYFPITEYLSVDMQVAAVRAVKSPFELEIMRRSGMVHRRILEERLPAMLCEGMSEAQLAAELYPVMVEEGHHGVARFGMFQTEIVIGHVCFGPSSLYPTSFDGPGGNFGLGPAVPVLGNRDHTLKKGDLVFVDIGCGVDGYHTDKTMTYMFGAPLPEEVAVVHRQCVDIQNRVAQQLRPGAIPSEIYRTTMDSLDPGFLENFMGYGSRQARFLGHGIGLLIDEFPVIAKGFDEPLEEGMVLALEPKKGIAHVGMVGIENTFEVTPSGGVCITGNHPGLMPVY
ncbi:Xaa-Pro peptidase family protein [Syntrophotalea acetylenica]|uniref:M24 family metallopeptidase n=1 Tax=Syntrophotalea acetylenica TaxID=29542 RepID=UPI002A363DF0|nr:Xaa-Pro peptidase family protein [Syntrophotalea acetylenica]MDY0260978.1 Xaa-Pro peptidase family protein [Syntrophotalea acetylenica]